MKKFYLFIFLSFALISGYSQSKTSSNAYKNPSSLNRDMTFQWDTIIVYDTVGLSQRWLQEMDTYSGSILSKTIQQRNGTDWVNVTQYVYTYTSFFDIETITTKFWNNNDWENHSFDTYYYNSQQMPEEEIYQLWDNGNWVNDERYTWEYNNNGDNTLMKGEAWNGIWENSWQYIMTYDGNHNMVTSLSQNWETGAWVNGLNMIYTYDNNHHMLSEQQQQWLSNTWENVYLITYTWDSNGYNTSYLMQMWQNGNWVDQWLHTLTYDGNGNMTEEIWQLWDNGAWVNFYRNAKTYDSQNNMVTDLWQNWDAGDWRNYRNYTYTYDLYRNSLTGQYDEWVGGNWHPAMWNIWVYCMSAQTDIIINNHRYEAHFTSFTSGVSDHQKNELKIYPNPAGASVNIDIPSNVINGWITIIDINGKEVLKTPAAGSKAVINTSSLPAGEYLVRFSGKGMSVTGVMMKK